MQEVKSLTTERRKLYLQYRSKTIKYDQYKRVKNRVQEEIQSIKCNF